ncbi:recombinase family protein [Dysgonomonas sp. 520]|uniref:recombinase family protein n=1 Tax=Dysgonomonas sp. 520 TaxID=2302931 RepID=UPI0013D77E23|nr:recombinase family protein [Dysgonomonas sp. 520]NDW10784.1 recombinase family protein [Dysgonomonas sp. 520]
MGKKKVKRKIIEYANLKEKVAVVWTRVSTKEQADNNNSLEIQKKECELYAKRNNIEIVEYFGGTNESAKKEGKLYQEMIAKVAKMKEVNIILVYSFDRFSRAGDEGILTKRYLKSKGIYVVSITQATDPDNPAGEFMENILFLFNQFENNLRKGKCEAGMKECLEKGYWYARPPMGFDKKKEGKEHIVTVNKTGELLREAFYWKAKEGLTDVQIVERLKAHGLKIYKQKLSEIFHNPFYCGKIKHALLGDTIIDGKQEILAPVDVWNKVNGIESNIGYSHAIETPMYPLKRHVICDNCGCYLTGYEVKTKRLHYYKCNTKGCKSNHNIVKIHDGYSCLLSGYTIPEELIPITKKVLTKVFKERNDNQSCLHKELSKQLTECNNQIKDVNVKCGMGYITTEVYETTISVLKDKKASIENELEKSKENLSNLQKFIDSTLQIACKLGDLWVNSNFSIQQKLQSLVFPEGVIYNKETNSYLTKKVNSVFTFVSNISAFYEIHKNKKEPLFSDSFSLVAETGLEPMTSRL